jgi:hypothetical protein
MDAAMNAARRVGRTLEGQPGDAQMRDPRRAIAPMRRFAYTAAHGSAKALCRALADAAAIGLLAPPRDPRADQDDDRPRR